MNELINYLQSLWKDAIVPTIKSSWEKSSKNTDRIVKAVNDKEVKEDLSINNFDEAVTPIVEAQDKTTKAIENIEPVKIDSLESGLKDIKTSIDDKDLSVNVETDLKPVTSSIESLKNEFKSIIKAIPSKVSTKEIENVLGSILTELENKETDTSKIEKLLGELKTSIESLSLDVVIPEFPDFEQSLKKYIKEGRLKVEVDRTGGGGGLTQVESEALQGVATEAKQDEVIGLKANRILIDGNYIYEGNSDIGSATSASVWQISRFDKVNLITVWAGGNANFLNVWDDVTSLTYL